MKSAARTRQIHVRISAAMKKAVKMFCVRQGTTEQAWVEGLIEDRLRRKAPDLWSSDDKSIPDSHKSKPR